MNFPSLWKFCLLLIIIHISYEMVKGDTIQNSTNDCGSYCMSLLKVAQNSTHNTQRLIRQSRSIGNTTGSSKNKTLNTVSSKTQNGSMVLSNPSYEIVVLKTSPAEWVEIGSEDLKCPLDGYQQMILRNSGSVQGFGFLHALSEDHVLGYKCTKYKLTTQCSTNAVWGQTKRRFKTGVANSDWSECWNGVVALSQGKAWSNKLSYPDGSCCWKPFANCNRYRTSYQTIIEPFRVQFNPTSKAYVSSLFIGGSCKSSACETIYEESIWRTTSDLNHLCPSESQDSGIIMAGDDGRVILRSEIIGDITFNEVCQMDFCGKSGYRTGKGFFMTLDQPLSPMIPKIDPCPTDDSWIPDGTYKDKVLRRNIDSNQDQLLCLLIKEKVETKSQISAADLSVFRPSAPGLGTSFKYDKRTGRLYQGTGEYIGIHDIETEAPREVGRDGAGNKVYLSYLDEHEPCGSTIVDGLFLDSNSCVVHVPIEKEIDNRHRQRRDLASDEYRAPNPVAKTIKTTVVDSVPADDGSGNPKDVSEIQKHHLIWTIVVAGLGGVAILIGIICCCRLCSNRAKISIRRWD